MWSTVASWITLLAITAAVASYYNPQLFRQLIPSQPQSDSVLAESGNPTNKRQKSKRALPGRPAADLDASPSVGSIEQITKRRKVNSTNTQNQPDVHSTKEKQPTTKQEQNSELSNQDFAQQLVKAQAGTQLGIASKGTSKKERREAKALQNGHASSGISTETSSTGGRDGDDDLSPVGSPSSEPISTAPTSRAGDISDMLEPAAAKPTTLRLTGVFETKPKTPSQSFEQVLSKKQRQRRAKQEENKKFREEADRIQEAKKQAQMRSARMAEGSSNQTKANTFTSNAWQGGKSAAAPQIAAPTSAPLLDTFTVMPPSSTEKPVGVIGSALNHNNGLNGIEERSTPQLETQNKRPNLTSKTSWADEVDEFEQNKWASQLAEEEKWESVANKKSKKPKKDADTNSDASGSVPQIIKPKSTVQQTNGTKQPPIIVNRYQSMEQLGGGDNWEA